MTRTTAPIKISVDRLEVPLTMPVTQASSSRSATSAVAVTAGRGAHVGLGEGCPRPYVTGETLEGAVTWCEKTAPRLRGIADLDELWALSADLDDEISTNPSAWCALELALLDLLAREADCSVERLLGIDTTTTTFAYTAVVDDSSDAQFDMLRRLYADLGFSDFKLKVNGAAIIDAGRVAQLRDVGAQSIRLDANNFWGVDTDEAIRALSSIDGWWAVEEPFTPGSAQAMSTLANALQCSVILDESLTNTGGVEQFSHLPGSWVANVKVSKSGGMRRALAIIEAATDAGWPIVIGAQVGETSVLTRAGLAAARAAGSALRAIEGAFGTWLLTAEPVSPTVMFGGGGVLDLETIDIAPTGWGLSMRADI